MKTNIRLKQKSSNTNRVAVLKEKYTKEIYKIKYINHREKGRMKYINRKRIITEVKELEHVDRLYTNKFQNLGEMVNFPKLIQK